MQPTATKLCKLIYFGRKFYCWENVNLSRVNGHCWGKFVTFLGGKWSLLGVLGMKAEQYFVWSELAVLAGAESPQGNYQP